MDSDTFQMLHDAALELAYRYFDEPTDDHIEAIFERLEHNYWRGLGMEGAVTVH